MIVDRWLEQSKEALCADTCLVYTTMLGEHTPNDLLYLMFHFQPYYFLSVLAATSLFKRGTVNRDKEKTRPPTFVDCCVIAPT